MGEEAMAAARVAAKKLEVEGMTFAPLVRPPGSSKTHFLAGAGVRGLEIGGKFVVFTAIGVYMECDAVSVLAEKWKGKAAEELANSVDFFRDIWAGSFEKFTRVSMVLPLTGQQYTEKVSENCVAHWKAAGIYTDAEAAAIDKFKQVFASENLPPGSSTFFTHSPTGSLTIAFSKDGSIPEAGVAVIENETLTQALLESIIGEHGVSPAAKQSVALRMSEFMSKAGGVQGKTQTEQPAVAIA